MGRYKEERKNVYMRQAASLIVIVILGLSQSTRGEEFPIKAHAETQSLLAQIMHPPEGADDAFEWGVLTNLRRVSAKDEGQFVEQVVFYIAHMEEKVLGVLLYRILEYCQVSKSTKVEAMSRFAYSDNKELQKEARRMLRSATTRAAYQNYVDLGEFRIVLGSKVVAKEIARPAKRWVFEAYPNSAFLFFIGEAEGKEITGLYRLERVVSNALFEKKYLGGIAGGRASDATLDAIRTLTKSSHWWARMFAAEIMVQNREFRDPESIKSLANDSEPLVRGSIAALKTEDKNRVTPAER